MSSFYAHIRVGCVLTIVIWAVGKTGPRVCGAGLDLHMLAPAPGNTFGCQPGPRMADAAQLSLGWRRSAMTLLQWAGLAGEGQQAFLHIRTLEHCQVETVESWNTAALADLMDWADWNNDKLISVSGESAPCLCLLRLAQDI